MGGWGVRKVLYYGPHWHHETQNLVTPTVTLTDTVAHAGNYRGLASKLHGDCARDSTGFSYSAPLCDALDQCLVDWERAWGGHTDTAAAVAAARARWPPWRSIATPEVVDKREATRPQDNNYDGRNYINE